MLGSAVSLEVKFRDRLSRREPAARIPSANRLRRTELADMTVRLWAVEPSQAVGGEHAYLLVRVGEHPAQGGFGRLAAKTAKAPAKDYPHIRNRILGEW